MDLSQPMDDALFREIERAWHAHCILLFRGQTLDDLQQVAFASRFGELAHTLKAYEGGKLPPEGGNTIFASMYAACDALPPDLRQKLEGRLAVNSYEPGYGTSNVKMRIKTPAPPTASSFAHPVIRTHPATGRKALYVNRLMTECIVGVPREESDALLERVFDHQEQPQFQYEHRWQVGDLLIWDNRCTLHARKDFPATHLRKLRRVAVKGDRPV